MNALLIVDIQYDFLPGGALQVNRGDEIIPIVNELQNKFECVVATKDWHPADHKSFAANHNGKQPGDRIKLNGQDQILWPVHCVQNSRGSEITAGIHRQRIEKIILKGTNREIDSYSGFFDNGHLQATELEDYLRSRGVNAVYIVGLAADYCVKFTALDAVELGFTTHVISEATRAVNLQSGDFEKALEEMKEAGVTLS